MPEELVNRSSTEENYGYVLAVRLNAVKDKLMAQIALQGTIATEVVLTPKPSAGVETADSVPTLAVQFDTFKDKIIAQVILKPELVRGETIAEIILPVPAVNPP
jgi:hypothetical protein